MPTDHRLSDHLRKTEHLAAKLFTTPPPAPVATHELVHVLGVQDQVDDATVVVWDPNSGLHMLRPLDALPAFVEPGQWVLVQLDAAELPRVGRSWNGWSVLTWRVLSAEFEDGADAAKRLKLSAPDDLIAEWARSGWL